MDDRDLYVKFPRLWHHAVFLFLLLERPSHGYELFERLSEFGYRISGAGERGNLYRFLHELEEQYLISHTWQQPKRGPGRRLYHVTPSGIKKLEELRDDFRRIQSRIEHLMHRSEDTIAERVSEQGLR